MQFLTRVLRTLRYCQVKRQKQCPLEWNWISHGQWKSIPCKNSSLMTHTCLRSSVERDFYAQRKDDPCVQALQWLSGKKQHLVTVKLNRRRFMDATTAERLFAHWRTDNTRFTTSHSPVTRIIDLPCVSVRWNRMLHLSHGCYVTNTWHTTLLGWPCVGEIKQNFVVYQYTIHGFKSSKTRT